MSTFETNTSVEISDRLVKEVMEVFRAKTQSAAVEEALRRVLSEEQREKTIQSIHDRGSEDGVDSLRKDRTAE